MSNVRVFCSSFSSLTMDDQQQYEEGDHYGPRELQQHFLLPTLPFAAAAGMSEIPKQQSLILELRVLPYQRLP